MRRPDGGMRKGYSTYRSMQPDDSSMNSDDDWDGWIGRTATHQVVLDPAAADRLAVTLDREPGFEVGSLLPHAWHWLYFHEIVAASSLGADGHPRPGVTM